MGKNKPELRYLHMDITVKCNLSCKHCFYGDYNEEIYYKKELSLDRLTNLIDEAISMGCEKIIFSGGEVLTSPKFIPLLNYCKDSKLKTIFITNGTLINDNIIRNLLKVKDNIDEIKISYEGENNDYIRGKGTGANILQAIEKFSEYNFPWTMNTVINKFNIDHLDDLYNYLCKYNPKYWRIDIPFVSGRYIDYKDDIGIFDIEYIVKKISKILEKHINEKNKPFEMFVYNLYSPGLENFDIAEKPKNIHPCSYNKRNLGIRGLGEITPCSRFLDLKLGSVRDASIRDIKNSDAFKEYWNIKIEDIKECKDCRYIKICGAGCRANAFENYGDIMRKDPLNCEIFPNMEKYIIPLFSNETQESFNSLLVEHRGNKI